MIVGIDASNLRAGGGVTHLRGILDAGDPPAHGIERVVVWSGKETLDQLPARPWLTCVHEPALDGSLAARLWWQGARLSRLAARCDLLFAPGGLLGRTGRPTVTMCRNMLPFDPVERARFRRLPTAARLRLLRWGQQASFQRADGVIFLTEYARASVTRSVPLEPKRVVVIPHGVDDRFRMQPRAALPVSAHTPAQPVRVLYVSTVSPYKHQWHVAEAVAALRRAGVPIALDLVGPSEATALARLKATLARLDPAGQFLHYVGACSFAEIHRRYQQADLFAFASSCENMPNILLEAMAAGLPIASSAKGPMPEVLADAGAYFDPEQPEQIAQALRELLADPARRARCARAAFERSATFTWSRCAGDTFRFLRRAHDESPLSASHRRTIDS